MLDMSLWQSAVLALIQGITEFLPISSSGHLLLPSLLLGWPDQGLPFDIAVHGATLFAVLVYTRREIGMMIEGLLLAVREKRLNQGARLALLLVLATVPAGLAGILLQGWVESSLRALPTIASTSILFGLLLWIADGRRSAVVQFDSISVKQALIIGCAQMLAIIPGTSRSGVTMTAALWLGMGRRDAARFSFLLAIPIIAASGLLATLDYLREDATGSVAAPALLIAMPIAAATALLSMQLLMRFVESVGFFPFVIYRLLLGLLLFAIMLL